MVNQCSVVLTRHPWIRQACWWLFPRWWGPSAGFQGLLQWGCAGDTKDDMLMPMWCKASHSLADHTFFWLTKRIKVCVPLRGQTHRSCDGQWRPSSPHLPQSRTHYPAPSAGHLCNKGTMLKQNGDGVYFYTVCQKPGVKKINVPMSELAATRTFPPPSMKEVIVSTLMFPPKSTQYQT